MNKQNLRPCVGGWLLIAAGALSLTENMISLIYNRFILGMPIRYMTSILGYSFLPGIIYALPLIVLGTVLVIKNQGIPVAISCGIGLAVELVYPLLSNLLARWLGLAMIGQIQFNFLTILNALAFVLLALLALTAASANNPLKKFWWLPAIPVGLATIIFLIRDIPIIIDYFIFRNVLNFILNFLFKILAAAGFFFAGQWLADPLRKKPIYRPAPQVPQGNYYNQPQYYQPPQQPYPQPQYRPPVPQPVQSQPAAANSLVQELERAKHLLDSGAINQEEYDALKKRLLG